LATSGPRERRTAVRTISMLLVFCRPSAVLHRRPPTIQGLLRLGPVSLFLAQLHIARAIGVLLTAMRARTLPAVPPGEGLVVNLDCVTNRKLSTAARAIHEPPLFYLWHLGASRTEPSDPSSSALFLVPP
jgi:hypothetical protein